MGRGSESLEHHGSTLDVRLDRGDRDDGVLRARAARPRIRSGLRRRLRARLHLWIRPGSLALWAGRGGVGARGRSPQSSRFPTEWRKCPFPARLPKAAGRGSPAPTSRFPETAVQFPPRPREEASPRRRFHTALLFGALAVLPSCLPGAACGAEGGAQSAGTPPPLPKEEVAARREALKNSIFEPVVIEAQSFRLAFERASSSFLIEDRRTGVGWHSPLGRKGFATVIVRDGGKEFPIDNVEDLRSEEKEIRFRGRSSAGEIPEIIFRFRVLAPLVGLEISFEVSAEAPDRVAAVRLLDGALWVADADGGGALLPSGLGEWQPAASGPDFRRRFRLQDGPCSAHVRPSRRRPRRYWRSTRTDSDRARNRKTR